MAFRGEATYIAPTQVVDWLTQHDDIISDATDRQFGDEAFADWESFVYRPATNTAYFIPESDMVDGDLIVRKPFDMYQFARQTQAKIDSKVPAKVADIFGQTINQNVSQMLRIRAQWNNGPFNVSTSRVAMQERGEISKQSNLRED